MKTVRILFCAGLLFLSHFGSAQPAPPGGGGGSSPSCWPPTNCSSVPVDGGIALLMAAGALYGAKRLKKSI